MFKQERDRVRWGKIREMVSVERPEMKEDFRETRTGNESQRWNKKTHNLLAHLIGQTTQAETKLTKSTVSQVWHRNMKTPGDDGIFQTYNGLLF